MKAPSTAVIVLSKLDDRYYLDLCGRANWTLDFSLVKEGERTPIASSNHSYLFRRSVNLEAALEAGSYLVYVRLDRTLKKAPVSRLMTGRFVACSDFEFQDDDDERIDDCQLRKLSRILTARASSKSIVASELSFYFAIHVELMYFD